VKGKTELKICLYQTKGVNQTTLSADTLALSKWGKKWGQ